MPWGLAFAASSLNRAAVFLATSTVANRDSGIQETIKNRLPSTWLNSTVRANWSPSSVSSPMCVPQHFRPLSSSILRIALASCP